MKTTRTVDGTKQRRCSAAEHKGSRWLPVTRFQADRAQPGGLKSSCRDCRRAGHKAAYAANPEPLKADQRARRAERSARADVRDLAAIEKAEAESRKVARAQADRADRLASDTAPLRPEDFDAEYDTSVANDPGSRGLSAAFIKEKRQAFSRQMGQHAHHVRAAAAAEQTGRGDLVDSMPAEAGTYVGQLAEQEARFGRRRLARSISLFAAGEEQARRLWVRACQQYLTGRVVPTGYAAKPSRAPIKRSVCLLLSDLHLGADLKAAENPMPFRAIEEARRLEYILRQCMDYKPQYRRDSELVLLLNGDLIEGLLMHDFRDGAPLTEQKVIFQRHMERFVGECARAYPRVRVFCQPGNHGRDKVRHPGRATSSKWDGHEWALMYALSRACSSLKNVTWDLPFRAICKVDLHGSYLGLTHSDTEVAIGAPDRKARDNAQILAEINSTRLYGVEFAAWAFGHYHTGRYLPRKIREIHNAALVPPNGHARGAGYVGESCGQFMWEAVPGFPVGDVRFIEVGRTQDTDERLGSIIEPFRFDLDVDGSAA